MRSLAANALNAVWGAVAVLTLTGSLAAQGAKPTDTKGPLPVANPGDQVLVKREAARLIDPEKYRSHLYLEPLVSVTLSAPFDGIVRQVSGSTRHHPNLDDPTHVTSNAANKTNPPVNAILSPHRAPIQVMPFLLSTVRCPA